MKTPIIAGLGGSLRRESRSLVALGRALRCAEANGAATELIDVCQLDLPMFRPGAADFPPAARRMADAVAACDALVVCSPVYQDAVSGAVKNALDFLHDAGATSRALAGKRAGVMAVAQGANTANTLACLHAMCAALGADVSRVRVGLPEDVFDIHGTVYDPVTEERLEAMMIDLVGGEAYRGQATALASGGVR
jgi:FMN reductase